MRVKYNDRLLAYVAEKYGTKLHAEVARHHGPASTRFPVTMNAASASQNIRKTE